MYLKKEDRDSIVNFLQNVVVPAPTGASIMQIVNLLSNLPEEKPEAPKE
jgi:hypothetical protein